jgi:sulfopyruvate decarboxylase alpha subunit
MVASDQAKVMSMQQTPTAQHGGWQQDIFSALKRSGVEIIAYVPDAAHAAAIDAANEDPETHAVSCTTEEEGIAVCAGSHLGGKRAALLMQSSGVGNCINMLSLIRTCRFPLLVLVTMRGEWAEFNPWQSPMGQVVEKSLGLMGVQCFRAELASEVLTQLSAAAESAFAGDQACALILGQRLIGRKTWVE